MQRSEEFELNGVPLCTYPPYNANGSAILYAHGGGWIGGHLGGCDEPVRAIANETGAVVVATTYHLAPEARFETPHGIAQGGLRRAESRGGTSEATVPRPPGERPSDRRVRCASWMNFEKGLQQCGV